MKRIRVITNSVLALIFFVLASCNGQVTEYPQPQETSTRTPALTPSPHPTYVHPTMQPAYATWIAVIKETLTAYPLTQTARLQNAWIDCNGLPYNLGVAGRIYSPSQKWLVAYCQYPDTGTNYTRVINVTNEAAWEVPYSKSEEQNSAISDNGLMLFRSWSLHEKYAYFVRYFCCVNGPDQFFINGHGLYRLDLTNGDLLEIEQHATAFSFSPDGENLARFDPETQKVIIENLEAEKRLSYDIDKKFGVAGFFNWSPDGSKVVFTAAEDNWFEMKTGFALYLLDMKKQNTDLLLYKPGHDYKMEKWLSNEEIHLFDNSWEGEHYILNVTTHELTPSNLDGIPLTPTP